MKEFAKRAGSGRSYVSSFVIFLNDHVHVSQPSVHGHAEDVLARRDKATRVFHIDG